jgi:Protein of unknown function (DUF3024)
MARDRRVSGAYQLPAEPALAILAEPMARTSASRKSQRTFTVFDFVPFLVRRVLAWRIGPRGVLLSRTSPNGVLTVVHRLRDGCSGEIMERRIAQLRPETDSYQLYWKKGNGRWTAYYDDRGDAFVGSLADCLREISRDPFSCYWS